MRKYILALSLSSMVLAPQPSLGDCAGTYQKIAGVQTIKTFGYMGASVFLMAHSNPAALFTLGSSAYSLMREEIAVTMARILDASDPTHDQTPIAALSFFFDRYISELKKGGGSIYGGNLSEHDHLFSTDESSLGISVRDYEFEWGRIKESSSVAQVLEEHHDTATKIAKILKRANSENLICKDLVLYQRAYGWDKLLDYITDELAKDTTHLSASAATNRNGAR